MLSAQSAVCREMPEGKVEKDGDVAGTSGHTSMSPATLADSLAEQPVAADSVVQFEELNAKSLAVRVKLQQSKDISVADSPDNPFREETPRPQTAPAGSLALTTASALTRASIRSTPSPSTPAKLRWQAARNAVMELRPSNSEQGDDDASVTSDKKRSRPEGSSKSRSKSKDNFFGQLAYTLGAYMKTQTSPAKDSEAASEGTAPSTPRKTTFANLLLGAMKSKSESGGTQRSAKSFTTSFMSKLQKAIKKESQGKLYDSSSQHQMMEFVPVVEKTPEPECGPNAISPQSPSYRIHTDDQESGVSSDWPPSEKESSRGRADLRDHRASSDSLDLGDVEPLQPLSGGLRLSDGLHPLFRPPLAGATWGAAGAYAYTSQRSAAGWAQQCQAVSGRMVSKESVLHDRQGHSPGSTVSSMDWDLHHAPVGTNSSKQINPFALQPERASPPSTSGGRVPDPRGLQPASTVAATTADSAVSTTAPHHAQSAAPEPLPDLQSFTNTDLSQLAKIQQRFRANRAAAGAGGGAHTHTAPEPTTSQPPPTPSATTPGRKDRLVHFHPDPNPSALNQGALQHHSTPALPGSSGNLRAIVDVLSRAQCETLQASDLKALLSVTTAQLLLFLVSPNEALSTQVKRLLDSVVLELPAHLAAPDATPPLTPRCASVHSHTVSEMDWEEEARDGVAGADTGGEKQRAFDRTPAPALTVSSDSSASSSEMILATAPLSTPPFELLTDSAPPIAPGTARRGLSPVRTLRSHTCSDVLPFDAGSSIGESTPQHQHADRRVVGDRLASRSTGPAERRAGKAKQEPADGTGSGDSQRLRLAAPARAAVGWDSCLGVLDEDGNFFLIESDDEMPNRPGPLQA